MLWVNSTKLPASRYWLGRHLPEATKKKISKSKKGVPNLRLRGTKMPEYLKERLRIINTGKKDSEETKQKKRLARLGYKMPLDVIEKIKETSIKRFLHTKGFCRTCKRAVKPEECSPSALKKNWWYCLECERKRSKVRRLNRREGILRAYGNKCACAGCNVDIPEFLTVDHINGGGRQHRIQLKNALYDYIERNDYPKEFRLLCYNCNQARSAYGYCPHEKYAEKMLAAV